MRPQSNRGKQLVLRLVPVPGAPALGKRRMSSSASSAAGSQPLHGGSLAASQIFSRFKLSATHSKVPPPRRRVDQPHQRQVQAHRHQVPLRALHHRVRQRRLQVRAHRNRSSRRSSRMRSAPGFSQLAAGGRLMRQDAWQQQAAQRLSSRATALAQREEECRGWANGHPGMWNAPVRT